MTGIRRSDETLLQLIAARDPAAAAGFYDGHAGSVMAYCRELCPRELIDEATLAAFVDFLGRVDAAERDADADDLLRRGARTAASGRMDLSDARQPECYATPELIAARISGELARDDQSLRQHLKRCQFCERNAERLERAEGMLTHAAVVEPPGHLRDAWLELGAQERMPEVGERGDVVAAGPVAAAENEPAAEPEAERAAEAEAERAAEPEAEREPEPPKRPVPPPPAPVQVRARRGGLVGAARRLASSTRRNQ